MQTANAYTLQSAFKSSSNVILFLVAKSKVIQGFVRMLSLPSTEIRPPKWMGTIRGKTTAPFKVEWFTTTAINDHKGKFISNSFTNNEPVTYGGDGQEINLAAGYKLFSALFFSHQEPKPDRV